MPVDSKASTRPTWRAVWLLAVAGVVVATLTLGAHWWSGESLSPDSPAEGAMVTAPPPDEGAAAPFGTGVAILGDSLVFVSTPALREKIGSVYPTQIEGEVGATSGAMVDEAESMAARHPDQVVIDLGTNDAILGTTLSDAMAQYQEIIDVFHEAGAECIHLVNLNTRMGKLDPRVNDRAQQFNEFIQALTNRPDIQVIDWDGMLGLAADDPSAAPFLSDTVHPTADGSRVLAWLVYNSLDRACG